MLSANHTTSLRPFVTVKELLFIVILLLSAILWLCFSGSREKGTQCEIYLDGQLVSTVSLSRDQVFSLPEIPEVVFCVSEGAICFHSSDCPDQTCVQTGFINEPGQYAICLPHRLMLEIPRDPDVPIDGVTSQSGGEHL